MTNRDEVISDVGIIGGLIFMGPDFFSKFRRFCLSRCFSELNMEVCEAAMELVSLASKIILSVHEELR